eukprot:6134114-Alexandrium_andersonii.AAC.1
MEPRFKSPSDPPEQAFFFHHQIRDQHATRHRTRPSGASGINAEAALGPAQFKLRTLDILVHARQSKPRACVYLESALA